MALTQISTNGIKDANVNTADIADDAVTNAKLASGINGAKITNSSIQAIKIQDANITTAKIANNAVTTAKIADTTITAGKIASNAVYDSAIQSNAVTTAKIADQAVTLAKLPHGTSSNNGKFLRANNGADPTFESIPAGVTINNQSNNRLISMTGTTNVLDAEADLIYDGTSLNFAHGKGARLSYIRPTSQSNTNTGNTNQQYWKIGEIGLNGSEGAVITLVGANGYSSGSAAAGETTIVLRGSNGSTLLGFWYSETPGGDTATYSDVRWKHISGVNYELWVSAGPYNNIAPIVKTTGTFDNTNAAGTGSNNAPTGSTALPSSHRKKVGSIDTIEYQSTGTIFKKNIYVASGEGIYMDGGSTSANHFDDYEEGSWVPVVKPASNQSAFTYGTSNDYELRSAAASGATNSVTYTKIGNRVFISFSIYFNTGGTSRVNISLPFAIKGNDYQVAGHIGYYKVAGSSGAGFLGNGLNSIDIFELDGDGNHPNLSYASNTELYINLQYETN